MTASGQFQGSGRDAGDVSAAAPAAVGDVSDVPVDHPRSLVALNREVSCRNSSMR